MLDCVPLVPIFPCFFSWFKLGYPTALFISRARIQPDIIFDTLIYCMALCWSSETAQVRQNTLQSLEPFVSKAHRRHRYFIYQMTGERSEPTIEQLTCMSRDHTTKSLVEEDGCNLSFSPKGKMYFLLYLCIIIAIRCISSH